MNRVNWTVVAVVGIIAILAVMLATSLLGSWGYGGYGGWGMMGPWMMGGMFFMWLIPMGFIVLVALGIAWVMRSMGGTSAPSAPGRNCPSCGRAVQNDWRNCPYCGNELPK